MLQFRGSQRVGHDLATEQQQQLLNWMVTEDQWCIVTLVTENILLLVTLGYVCVI